MFILDALSSNIQVIFVSSTHSDKAGGYGIQNIGSVLVEKIDGDFFTVMGLPLYRLSQKLTTLYQQYQ